MCRRFRKFDLQSQLFRSHDEHICVVVEEGGNEGGGREILTEQGMKISVDRKHNYVSNEIASFVLSDCRSAFTNYLFLFPLSHERITFLFTICSLST